MNISAIGSTPIKPQVSFRSIESEHEKLHQMAGELNSGNVDSEDIKNPLAILVSVAALVGGSYAGGKLLASKASTLYQSASKVVKPVIKETADDLARVAKEGADDAAKVVKDGQLGVVVENGLKKVANAASKGIEKLRPVAADQTTVLTKPQMVKNAAANVLEGTLNFAKNAYKKVAYAGIADDVVGGARAQEALENIGGIVGVAAAVPRVLGRDANGDGVKDILQKSENAYTQGADNLTKTTGQLDTLTEVFQLLT